MTRKSPAGRTRPLAAWAVALALLARLMVPQGWMPAGAGWRLVPCSGHGAMLASGQSGHHHGGEQAQDGACPFAAAAVAMLDAETPPLPPLPPKPLAVGPAPALLVAVGQGLAAPPPPPTGPPLSSA